jgi:hypothetical protein
MRYFIQTKGHYKQDWTETHADTKSTSGYTIVSVPANSFTPGRTVDVQIKAWLAFIMMTECGHRLLGHHDQAIGAAYNQ